MRSTRASIDLIRRMLRGVLLVGLLPSCASTTFYGPTGKPVARLQGDVKNLTVVLESNGDMRWTVESIDHSTATLAQGQAASDKLQAGGLAVAVSGIVGALTH